MAQDEIMLAGHAADLKVVADTIAEMQRRIEDVTGARHSLYDPAVGIARSIAALSAAPAQPAAVEASRKDFVGEGDVVKAGVVYGPLSKDYLIGVLADRDLEIATLRARPSPTPAADADRVRETPGAAEAFDAVDVADRLIERAYGDEVPAEWTKTFKGVAKARSAMKSAPPADGALRQARIAGLEADLAKTERDYSELREAHDEIAGRLRAKAQGGVMRDLRSKLEAALAKPQAAEGMVSLDDFNPWGDVIENIHGSYSSESDALFIQAICAIRDGATFDFIKTNGFAGEFALYVLSGHDFLDYGTSPRGGWWKHELDGLLQPLIDKWTEYACIQWGMPRDTFQPPHQRAE